MDFVIDVGDYDGLMLLFSVVFPIAMLLLKFFIMWELYCFLTLVNERLRSNKS